MSGATSELVHLFRALKAPAAARALPALAERAREESWSYEVPASAALKRGFRKGQPRRGAQDQGRPLPGTKDARGVRLRFQRSVKKQILEHLGQLDFLHGRQNVILLGPPGHRQDTPRYRARRPRVPDRTARSLRDRYRMGRKARRRQAPGSDRGRAQASCTDPATRGRRGRLHPV
jgi:hypothetical protein